MYHNYYICLASTQRCKECNSIGHFKVVCFSNTRSKIQQEGKRSDKGKNRDPSRPLTMNPENHKGMKTIALFQEGGRETGGQVIGKVTLVQPRSRRRQPHRRRNMEAWVTINCRSVQQVTNCPLPNNARNGSRMIPKDSTKSSWRLTSG